jgi:hypothetical protein
MALAMVSPLGPTLENRGIGNLWINSKRAQAGRQDDLI